MLPSQVLTILFVSEIQASKRIFDGVFGWVKSVDEPVYVEYELGAGTRLGLMFQANTRHFLGDALGSRTFEDACPRAEIYLQFEDAETIIERLGQLGIECVSPLAERGWGDRVAYFQIPDGYILAIAEH
jgi:hypothetical protein